MTQAKKLPEPRGMYLRSYKFLIRTINAKDSLERKSPSSEADTYETLNV